MKLRIILQILLAIGHWLVIVGTAILSYYIIFDSSTAIPPGYIFLALGLPLVFSMRLRYRGGYDLVSDQSTSMHLQAVTLTWFQLSFFLAALIYITGSHAYVENEWLIAWLCSGWLGLMLATLLGRKSLSLKSLEAEAFINVAIVGAGLEGVSLIEQLGQSKSAMYRIVGVFDDRIVQRHQSDNSGNQTLLITGLDVMGTTNDLLDFSMTHQIDKIIVALPTSAEVRIKHLVQKLHIIPTEIFIYLYPLKDSQGDIFYQRLSEAPTLCMAKAPMQLVDAVLKRGMDIVLTVLAIPILLPLLLFIALLIRLDSPGPVLFRQERGGYRSQKFHIYKFRTMYHKKEDRMVQARPGDPRVTRVGRWLRRLSLDELPQVINVLTGELSLVGPRPHPTDLDIEYTKLLSTYLSRTRVKPGLTGWAQINGFRGVTDTTEKMQNRLDYDLFYINNWSLWFDIKILLKTFWKVIDGENAH